MRLYDGKKMADIQMNTWNGREYTPDWSIDFFETGRLQYDEDVEAYLVEDVNYCIDQANDWKNADGDFYEPDADTADRNVDVTIIPLYKVREDVDISRLGSHVTWEMRFPRDMVETDAQNFEMDVNDYIEEFLEEA